MGRSLIVEQTEESCLNTIGEVSVDAQKLLAQVLQEAHESGDMDGGVLWERFAGEAGNELLGVLEQTGFCSLTDDKVVFPQLVTEMPPWVR